MVGRVVEIETDGRHLAIHRGFLAISEKGVEIGKVPLDDIAAVIANAHGLTYSNNALVELSARGIPVVLCGANHMPAAIIWPVDTHHLQTGRMNDQIAASLPLKKRLWAQLVRAKILAQAATLAAAGAPNGGFFCCRARCARAIPTTSKRKRRDAIGRFSWDRSFAATRMAVESMDF
jgi:CRISP-associated protein Cas1